MDWDEGTSRQWTLSPQQDPIPRFHLLSGLQVRGFRTQPTDLPRTDPETLAREKRANEPQASSSQPSRLVANRQWRPMLLSWDVPTHL